ncbi:hypothetical protein BH10ACI1_BH10ACI1_28150 [soil metagenome]
MAEIGTQHKVRIIEFENSYSDDFARLNYEWIEEYFTIEAPDREMLDNTNEYIIKPGGQIFFGEMNGEICGTVALINNDNESFELAKMAVAPKYRGLKIGDKLMSACLEYAVKKDKKRIFLLSNTKLIPALNLYKKFGFVEIPLDPNLPYMRTDIQMELRLENKK